MRHTYEIILADNSKQVIEADMITISQTGDLSFNEKKLIPKTINGKETFVEMGVPLNIYATGQWHRVKRIKEDEDDI